MNPQNLLRPLFQTSLVLSLIAQTLSAATPAPEIDVQQPLGSSLVDGTSSKTHGSSEQREYLCRFIINDGEIGLPSDIVNATILG